jgi:hypothetical protein
MGFISMFFWKIGRALGLSGENKTTKNIVSPASEYKVTANSTSYGAELVVERNIGENFVIYAAVLTTYYLKSTDQSVETRIRIYDDRDGKFVTGFDDGNVGKFEFEVQRAHAKLQALVDDLNNKTGLYESYQEKEDRKLRERQNIVDKLCNTSQ